MSDTEIVLIGGQNDGERVTVPEDIIKSGVLMMRVQLKVPYSSEDPHGMKPCVYEYRRHDIRMSYEGTPVSLWISEETTPREALELLLKNYQPK